MTDDDLESAMLSAAAASLRRRADRQRKIAADWTITTEGGVAIKGGEAAIAGRIAGALEAVAAEFELELAAS